MANCSTSIVSPSATSNRIGLGSLFLEISPSMSFTLKNELRRDTDPNSSLSKSLDLSVSFLYVLKR